MNKAVAETGSNDWSWISFQSLADSFRSWWSQELAREFDTSAQAAPQPARTLPHSFRIAATANNGFMPAALTANQDEIDGLTPSKRFSDDVLDMQKDLAALGYDLEGQKQFVNNGVDGLYGDQTKLAVAAFQRDNGLDPTGIANAETLVAMREQVEARGVAYVQGMETHDRTVAEAATQTATNIYNTVANRVVNKLTNDVDSSYAFNKDANYLMNTGSDATLSYIEMAKEAAIEQGLDPVLFINQLASESSFDPRADSGRAVGIGQFTPATGAQYGLSGSDFYDPQKSITAAAAYMRDLTDKYGSQELALVAYNGGDRAISSAARQLGIGEEDMTVGHFVDAMETRYAARTSTPPSSVWDVETLGYVEKIIISNNENNAPTQVAGATPPSSSPAATLG